MRSENMKSVAIRAASVFMAAVLVLLAAGCTDMFRPPENTEGGLQISVADNTGGEKTVLPTTPQFEFSKFMLSFAGGGSSGGPAPVEVPAGETVTVNLPDGDWLITAEGYRATAGGTDEVVARGTFSLDGYTPGTVTSIIIPVSMLMDETKEGQLRVTVPGDPEYITTASFKITKFPHKENEPLIDWDLSNLSQLLEGYTLPAGYYWVEVHVDMLDGSSFDYMDIVHVYPYYETLLNLGEEDVPPDPAGQYTVTTEFEGNGTVSVQNGGNKFNAGAPVVFTAEPAEGYALYRAYVAGYVDGVDDAIPVEFTPVGGSETTFTFMMPAFDVTISALFYDPDESFPIVVNNSGGGTVTIEGAIRQTDGSYRARTNDSITVNMTANESYVVTQYSIETRWSNMGGASNHGESFDSRTFEMLPSEVSITVTFVPEPGGGTPGNPNIYYGPHGTNITFTADTYTVTEQGDSPTPVTLEIGNWIGGGTNRTLTPEQVLFDTSDGAELYTGPELENAVQSMLDGMSPEEEAETLAQIQAMGFTTFDDYIDWMMADTFGERSYDVIITTDNSLLMQERLPQSIGTNELSGAPYYGTKWELDAESDEYVAVPDTDQQYTFQASNNYNYQGVSPMSLDGSYAYDSEHKFVYLRPDTVNGRTMQDFYNEGLFLMGPNEAAYNTNGAFSLVAYQYDPVERLIDFGSAAAPNDPVDAFPITVMAPLEGGQIIANPPLAAEGQEVTLVIEPADNYTFDSSSLQVINTSSGEQITGRWESYAPLYIFTMPAAPVEVFMVFTPIE